MFGRKKLPLKPNEAIYSRIDWISFKARSLIDEVDRLERDLQKELPFKAKKVSKKG